MFDGSTDPNDHMFHYNQAMTLNASNDLLCKVFLASLCDPTLAWFHKLHLATPVLSASEKEH